MLPEDFGTLQLASGSVDVATPKIARVRRGRDGYGRFLPDQLGPLGGFTCRGCGEEKALAEFVQRKGGKRASLCHLCEARRLKRWVRDNRERQREIANAWKARNREQTKLSHHRLRLSKIAAEGDAFRERERRERKQWRARNPAKVKAIARRAYEKSKAKNPEMWRLRAKAAAFNRRVRKAKSPFRLKPWAIKKMARHQRGRCCWCSGPLGQHPHLDHRIPLARGGEHSGGNLVLSCAQCNLRKHTKMPWEFAGRLL